MDPTHSAASKYQHIHIILFHHESSDSWNYLGVSPKRDLASSSYSIALSHASSPRGIGSELARVVLDESWKGRKVGVYFSMPSFMPSRRLERRSPASLTFYDWFQPIVPQAIDSIVEGVDAGVKMWRPCFKDRDRVALESRSSAEADGYGSSMSSFVGGLAGGLRRLLSRDSSSSPSALPREFLELYVVRRSLEHRGKGSPSMLAWEYVGVAPPSGTELLSERLADPHYIPVVRGAKDSSSFAHGLVEVVEKEGARDRQVSLFFSKPSFLPDMILSYDFKAEVMEVTRFQPVRSGDEAAITEEAVAELREVRDSTASASAPASTGISPLTRWA